MARAPYDDDLDDDAPWLAEGVRESRVSTMVPRARLIGGGLVALVLIVLVALGIYVISARKQDGSSGFARAEDAPLITADTGPYKTAPTDPGGAAVTGLDDSIAAAGRGDDPGSAIDTTAVDEEPLARPGAATASPPTNLLPPDAASPPIIPPAPQVITRPVPPVVAIPVVKAVPPKAEARPVRPALIPEAKPKTVVATTDPLAPAKIKADAPAKAAAGGGPATLQLGAFSTEAKADAAWSKAAAKNAALAGLTKRIDPVERDGATLYRVRAGGVASRAAAVELCAKLKAAGDACLVI